METVIKKFDNQLSAESMFCIAPVVLEYKVQFHNAFYSDKANIVVTSGSSFASNFAQTLEPGELEMLAFSNFIQSRISYLNSLNIIGDNRISGRSLQPSADSIKLGIDILEKIKDWYFNVRIYKISAPHIIMSPIPIGGVGFEIVSDSSSKIFLNIFNDGSIDMQTEINNYYQEVETDIRSVKEQIIYHLSLQTGWHNNPRWTSSVPVC